MKAQKITAKNHGLGSRTTDNLKVSAKFFNDLVDDVAFLYPVINKLFKGMINLDKALTHYQAYTVTTDIAIIPSVTKEVGAYAELTLVADGSHTPAFDSAFTITPTSDAWDTTVGKVHKCGVVYDGTYIFYTLTVIN